MERNSNKITKEILVRLSQDDETAFDVIYWSYNTHVYNFANSLLYSPSAAQDITQNVFLKIWEKRHEIDPEQNFNAYLFTIPAIWFIRKPNIVCLQNR